MPDEIVVPVVVQVKPGSGMEPDLVVFAGTNKASTLFHFRLAGHKAWLRRLIEALEDNGKVMVNLVRDDFLSLAGKKYYLTKKVGKVKSLALKSR